MAAIILWFKDRPPRVIECPGGSRPEDLAKQQGALMYDYFESIHEANFRLANDPNRFHAGGQ